MSSQSMHHSVQSSTLADLLERVLDKGIVIAGDIRIRLVEVELLTIQIRLVVCSVEKAKELGLDWWNTNRVEALAEGHLLPARNQSFEARIAKLEAELAANPYRLPDTYIDRRLIPPRLPPLSSFSIYDGETGWPPTATRADFSLYNIF